MKKYEESRKRFSSHEQILLGFIRKNAEAGKTVDEIMELPRTKILVTELIKSEIDFIGNINRLKERLGETEE